MFFESFFLYILKYIRSGCCVILTRVTLLLFLYGPYSQSSSLQVAVEKFKFLIKEKN